MLFVHAAVQGSGAEEELVSALAALAGAPIDCAVLIRGGGSKTDLAVFDSRPVAEAVATAPFPVLTGLGHEIDQSIADLVAHTALKTPTRVAEHLVDRVARADQRLLLAARDLRSARRWSACAGGGRRWAAPSGGWSWLAPGWPPRQAGWPRSRGRWGAPGGCAWPGPRPGWRPPPGGSGRWRPAWWRGAAARRTSSARRLVAVARGRLREARATVDGLERLSGELAPQRALERGFSITRNAAGRALRQPAEAAAGDRITTQLAGGTLISRVEEETR